ncbi:OmpA family protein [Ideonella sp.]|uniref:OmpA family protein n=1 Tax=Ideonella sp. TaxID=1929293 RepID=UPI0035AF9BA3
MALPDPYATAKANLRDNVKVLLAAISGAASLLLAGTPFAGLGGLPLGGRLALAVAGLAIAVWLLARTMWLLLETLKPDLVGYQVLRDGFDPASIADAAQRAEIEDLRTVFDSQRGVLLPGGLTSPNVEALESYVKALWDALPAAPTPADLVDYERYHDALHGLSHWAAFVRFQRRVSRAMRLAFRTAFPALAGVLAFAWAVGGGAKPDAGAAAGPVVVNEQWTRAAGPAGDNVPPPRFGPIHFVTDRAELNDDSRALIAQARDHLREHPGTAVLVHAYTDTRGGDAHNARLAQRRAQAVTEELIRPGGLAPNRVFAAALGPNDLPVMTKPEKAEQENRSVWLQVVDLPSE